LPKKYIEKRRRGFFGWIMLGLFWAVNGLMVVWLGASMGRWGEQAQTLTTEAEQAGYGAGMAVGLTVILVVWACLAGITGLLAYMTRGRKEITEVEE